LGERGYKFAGSTEIVENPPAAHLVQTVAALQSDVSPLLTSAALFACDTIAVLTARILALILWQRINPGVTLDQDFGIWLSAALFLLAFGAFSLYGAQGLGAVEELRRVVLASALVSLVLTTTTFLTKDFTSYSRGLFLSSFILVTILVPAGRAILRYVCAGQPWWGVPVLILGAGKTGRLIGESLRGQPHIGFKPIAYLDDDESNRGLCAGVPVAGPLSLAPALGRRLGIDHALIAMAGLDSVKLLAVVERWGATFSHVIVVPNFFGIGTLWVSTRDLGGVLGLEVRQNLLIPANQWFKRVLDYALAVFFGFLALPAVALAALCVRIVSPGPAFFRQEREGANGRIIRILKLRTMHLNADELLTLHLSENSAARDEWNRYFKLKRDPRILPGIGRLLRRISLDELPQIWNVLKGEMSIVGPRPCPAYHLDKFSTEFREMRRRVIPGITGLWQVSCRGEGDLNVQESLDSYYIRNWSPWLDLHILIRTFGAVVFGRGAF
jgi:Undecaprenyl-phosphate galactose phosphotransferase WbaP